MTGRIAALYIPRIVLLTADALLRHQVGPCALNARRHGRLMIINHDVVLGSSLNDFAIVTDSIL